MQKTNLRSPLLFITLLITTLSATQVPVWAQQAWSLYERDYARPRDLVALQDDLNQLDLSLAALPRRHPRSDEFRQRTDEIRVEVQNLAERIRRDRRDGRYDSRYSEERYGADRRYLPTSLAEVATLRARIASLRDDVEDAQRRRAGNGDLVVPAGTEIEVMLDAGISSRWSNREDRIEASTTGAIRRNGRTLVPAGATVTGFVREVRSRRRGQEDGWLKLDFDSLILDGGPRVDLASHVVAVSDSPSSSRARNGALGALLGGIIGGIIEGKKGALIGAAVGAGGGLLATGGDDLDLPEGTLLVIRLDRPLMLPRGEGLASRRD